jgi:predicted adenine nucleotide alpha hydrolase (AANH) superfamily ATPase
VLVHICCSVDSHYFLQKLQNDFPNEKLIGFFYDPNIHPYSEYELRLLDVQRSCDMLGIELIVGEYDYLGWLQAVKGLEDEPEKGARCSVCFDNRFEASAAMAKKLNQKVYTSTLLTSPKKSLTQLELSGKEIGKRYGIDFIAPDYRKNSGTQEQNILAKKDKLYRQDYCGCMFALNKQRAQQNKISDELFCPISKQIQPKSIEDRIQLYSQRVQLEEKGIDYKIIKQRFLNYRLLRGYLKVRKKIVPVHFLPYSIIKNGYTRGKIEYSIDMLHYLNRDEVKFVSLKNYNLLTNCNYNSVLELIYNPPSFDIEIKARERLNAQSYDISAILVVDEIPTAKLEIICEAKVFEDVKEVLIKLNS